MRTLVAAVLVAPLVLVGACGSAEPSVAPSRTADLSRPVAPSSPPSSPSAPDAGPPSACKQVVKGIDAFNRGDYAATMHHFKKAVPLAKAALEDDDSRAAQDLLDAVLYYATLSPAGYPVAASNSDLFARFKTITLAQCEQGGSAPAPPTDPGVPV